MPINIENAQAPSLLRRLAAVFYDCMLLAALLMLAAALVVVPLGMGFDIDSEELARHPLFRLYLFMVILGFFCGFWIHGGQTLGMRAWGLRVVRDDGNRLHLRDALARFTMAALSWTALGAGFLWSLLDPENLTWHDHLSNTRLVILKQPDKR